MEQEYNEGRLDFRLLRPLPLWFQYLTEVLGPGLFGYVLLIFLLDLLLYVYAGVFINPFLAILAYPLYFLANVLTYFTLSTFVVDLGRVNILRWILSKIDTIFILVPRTILGDLPYLLAPSAYVYYWPAIFALNGYLPPFWFVGIALLSLLAILAERRMIRRLEVFGG